MESRAKVIAAFLGVFVAGAVFGAFFTVGVGSRWLKPAEPVPAIVTPAPVATTAPVKDKEKAPGPNQQRTSLLQIPQTWQAPELLKRYAARLDLTPEQEERINPLLQRASEDYGRLWRNTVRETSIILQRLQQDLAKELTPEQREKLARMEERQREALQKMELKQREQKAEQLKQQQKKTEPKKGGAKAKAAIPASAPAPSSSSTSTSPTTSATATGTATPSTATTAAPQP